MLTTVLVLALTALLVPSQVLSSPTGCTYYNSLKGYDCSDKKLETIPENLKSATEVLDVSANKIRKLSKEMLQNYPYLKKLYLNDNSILIIKPGTFEYTSDLEILDLSKNSIIEIPSSILHLPSLTVLKLSDNERVDILGFFNDAGTVTAPLRKLDLSYIPSMNQLPNFGVMMDLVELNISGNHLTNVSKAHFIGLCNLKKFINFNLTMEFQTACDCAKINRWFSMNKVISNPEFQDRCGFAGETFVSECLDEDIEPNAYELAIYEKCIADFEVRETLRSASQICLIVFGTIGGIILVVGICYVYYRFQRFPDDENKNVRTDLMTKTTLLTKEDLANS